MMQIWAVAVTILALIVAVWFAVPTLFRKWSSRRLERRVQDRRAIVLTYDDGPSQTLTQDLRLLLRRRGIRATFFLIGREAAQRPQAVRDLLADGHEVASHTEKHLNAWKTGPFRAVRDIQAGRRQLAEIGAPGDLFRPPFGKSTLLTLAYALANRIRLAFWTHDSRDSWNRLPVEQVLAQIQAAGGAVLLMHDFDRPRRGPAPELHREYVLKLTESIIDFAEKNDFRIVRFSDLFSEPRLDQLGEHS